MQYHLMRMVEILRTAELEGVSVDPEPQVKLNECSCRVASVQKGAPEIWTGTITHVENYDGEWERKFGATRTEKQTLWFKYRLEMRLERAIGPSQMVSSWVVDGRKTTHAETVDHRSCGDIGGTRDVSGSARDDGATIVYVEPVWKQPGKYRIGYPTNGATGTGSWKGHWSAKGCQIFNPVRDNGGLTPVTLVGYPPSMVWIDTEVEPSRPYKLSGSKLLRVPDDLFETPHIPRVTWNLERCGG